MKTVGKQVGGLAESVVKEAPGVIVDAGKAAVKDYGRVIGKGARTVGKWAVRCTVGVPSGKCGHDFKPPVVNTPPKPENGPGGWGRAADGRASWSGSARRIPDTRRARTLVTRTAPNKNLTPAVVRDRSVTGRPLGITRENLGLKKRPIARDRSVFGRPVGLGKRVKARPPVQGITREDLKPNRKAKGFGAKGTKLRRDDTRRRF